jgi:hypothetical protein
MRRHLSHPDGGPPIQPYQPVLAVRWDFSRRKFIVRRFFHRKRPARMAGK